MEARVVKDEVIGTAILWDKATPARLSVVCHAASKGPSGKGKFPITIPVKMRGDRDPDPKHSWGSPWEIEISGDVLTVRPSLKNFIPAHKDPDTGKTIPEKELFHNEGIWTVRFVRWHEGLDPDGYHALKQVNPGLEYR